MIIKIPNGHNLNFPEKELENDSDTSFDVEELKFGDDVYKNLPFPLDRIFNFIEEPQKKDMALLSLLTILSNIVRTLKVIYNGKKEGCQLFTYILGNPASSKGFATNFRETGVKLHGWLQRNSKAKNNSLELSKDETEALPIETFFLSGNISKAALANQLAANNGYGMFFETEADTLVSSNKSDHGSFSDILRRGFHGEPYSVDKVYMENRIEIEQVSLSVYITSTVNQCFKLLPNFEDGLFSRFAFYILSPHSTFQNPFASRNFDSLAKQIDRISARFFAIGVKQKKLKECLFEFTASQQIKVEAFFKRLDADLSVRLGHLKANGYRLSLILTRISMLLTYLRFWDEIKRKDVGNITCNDADFGTAILVTESLVNHLHKLNHLYSSNKASQKDQILINTNLPKNYEKIKQTLALHSNGLSTRKIAAEVLGDATRNGTISKWITKYANSPFLVLEPETPINIETEMMLRKSKVSHSPSLNSPFTTTASLLSICKRNSHDNKTVYNMDFSASLSERAKIIGTLPHFLAEGYLNDKNEIEKYSGFMGVLIPRLLNKSIQNFESLSNELKKIINVAFCGKTIIGDCLLLIPISSPTTLLEHHNALKISFQKLGISIADFQSKRAFPICFDDTNYVSRSTTIFTSLVD